MHKLTCPSISQFEQLVELKDYQPPTKKEYVRCLRKLAEHYHCDPATLTQDQLRAYFLFLRQDKHCSGSALSIIKAALQLFFRQQLGHADWTVFGKLVIRRGQPLPLVLSRPEVQRVLGVLREPRFRTCLRLIYHTGLRVGEAVRLKVTDLDGASLRLHVRQGKGGKDRCVPISAAMLQELRAFWKTHRHPVWLFPAPGCAWRERATPLAQRLQQADRPMSVSAVQNAFRLARAESGIHPQATVHTLRHCYATHLLEEGVSLRLISQYLGHQSLDVTVIYTHLTATHEGQARAALERLLP
ncbi:MAG: site-specific integrase [Verrucomicrobiae bacterium]|nr:site-specific integrase [Verrucomicrobiae bacterium]